MLTIGQLAARLRVTTRTLRHYEAIGLLLPTQVDDRTGYRSYGPDALATGLLVEQLKATGLALATITAVVHGQRSLEEALADRRAELRRLATELRGQHRAIDGLASTAVPLPAVLVNLPAGSGAVVSGSADLAGLAGSVRRVVQRLRRRLLADGMRPRSFSAVFPLALDDTVPFTVRAHVERGFAGAASWSAARAVRSVFAGPADLLPLAYEVALAAVERDGLRPTGEVVEHYLDMGTAPRTEVAVLVT